MSISLKWNQCSVNMDSKKVENILESSIFNRSGKRDLFRKSGTHCVVTVA